MQIKWSNFWKGEMPDIFIQSRPNFLDAKKKKKHTTQQQTNKQTLSERNFINHNGLVWLELKRLNLFKKKKVIRDMRMSERPVLRP